MVPFCIMCEIDKKLKFCFALSISSKDAATMKKNDLSGDIMKTFFAKTPTFNLKTTKATMERPCKIA